MSQEKMKVIGFDNLNTFKSELDKIITSLQSAIDKKTEIPTTLPANGGNAATVNGHTVGKDVPSNAVFTDTKYTAATAAPKANGTAAVGTSAKYAREDHVHPAQTSVSGNAGTATRLQTARKINGVAFNGSADITIKAAANGGNADTLDGKHASDFAASNSPQIKGELQLLGSSSTKPVIFAWNDGVHIRTYANNRNETYTELVITPDCVYIQSAVNGVYSAVRKI